MPELPEVYALAYNVEKECKGKKLLRIVTKEQGGGPREGLYDEIVFDKVLEQSLHQALDGHTLIGVGRKGKHLWWTLEGGGTGKGKEKDKKVASNSKKCASQEQQKHHQQHLLFHMGMTGSLVIQNKDIPQYQSFSIDTSSGSWPPKYTKAEFIFEDNIRIAYCDPRRWGRILLRDGDETHIHTQPPLKDLAPDAWKELPPLDIFTQKLQEGTGNLAVKAALLDQNKIVCGIGNWVGDEVLFQAQVDPAKKCHALTKEEITHIHTQITYVCATACQCMEGEEKKDFPGGWLFHFRWVKKQKGAKGPGGAALVFEEIGGRTTCIVPSVQRRRKRKGEEDEGEEVVEGDGGGKGKGKKKVKVEEEEEDGKSKIIAASKKKKGGGGGGKEGKGKRKEEEGLKKEEGKSKASAATKTKTERSNVKEEEQGQEEEATTTMTTKKRTRSSRSGGDVAAAAAAPAAAAAAPAAAIASMGKKKKGRK